MTPPDAVPAEAAAALAEAYACEFPGSTWPASDVGTWLHRHLTAAGWTLTRKDAREQVLREALEDVLRLGHIQDDGPSLCMCKTHASARAALSDDAP